MLLWAENGLTGLGKKYAATDKEAIEAARRNAARLSVFHLNLSNETVARTVTGQFEYSIVTLEPWAVNIVANPMITKVLKLPGFTAVFELEAPRKLQVHSSKLCWTL